MLTNVVKRVSTYYTASPFISNSNHATLYIAFYYTCHNGYISSYFLRNSIIVLHSSQTTEPPTSRNSTQSSFCFQNISQCFHLYYIGSPTDLQTIHLNSSLSTDYWLCWISQECNMLYLLYYCSPSFVDMRYWLISGMFSGHHRSYISPNR